MIADIPTDKADAYQLYIALDRIKRECPAFAAFLQASIEETTIAICGYDGTHQQRAVGALADLRKISSLINNPPMPNGDATASTVTGMVV